MIVPVRCFTCGKPIGQLWEKYKEKSKKEDKRKVLDKIGLKRYCCRSVFLAHTDLLETAAKFKKF